MDKKDRVSQRISIDMDDALLDDHIDYLLRKKKQIEDEYDNVQDLRIDFEISYDYCETCLVFQRDETDQEFQSRLIWQESRARKRKLEAQKKEEKDLREYKRLKKKYES